MSWSFFDKVYCISLKERTDRRGQALAQFKKVGLAPKVEFFLVKRDSDNSEENIYNSHILALSKGLWAGADNILVFEDDICFERFSYELLGQITTFLSQEKAWKMFFLGCLVSGLYLTDYPGIVKIKYRCSAHAYVINRQFAKYLVSLPWQETAFDDLLRKEQDSGYFAAYPGFAFQSNARTDNAELLCLHRVRTCFGGIKFIQKMNEFYHMHKLTLIALHFLLPSTAVLLYILW